MHLDTNARLTEHGSCPMMVMCAGVYKACLHRTPVLISDPEMHSWWRSGSFPCALADRTGQSLSSSCGGGIRHGGGLGRDGRFFPPTVIATGFGGGSIGTEDTDDGPVTCDADACIDATSWRCLLLFAAKSTPK